MIPINAILSCVLFLHPVHFKCTISPLSYHPTGTEYTRKYINKHKRIKKWSTY